MPPYDIGSFVCVALRNHYMNVGRVHLAAESFIFRGHASARQKFRGERISMENHGFNHA